MAVPKQKQSHTRTAKRRAQHDRVASPTVNQCPQCGAPRIPHRVCRTCGTYAGKQAIEVKVREPEISEPEITEPTEVETPSAEDTSEDSASTDSKA